MTDWIALGRTAAGARGFSLRGDRIIAQADAAQEREILDRLAGSGQVVRIGDGAPDSLPAPLLPGTGRALPALEQENPPDVIGAWVRLRLAGFASDRPHWDGVIHTTEGGVSHWIHLSAGEAVSSQSFLTPRLVTALGGSDKADPDALADSLSRPERLAAHLRAAEVSGNAAAITGHLMGAELAAARPYWLGRDVALILQDASAWTATLSTQGVPCTVHDPDACLATGLAALAHAFGLSETS
jgi:hypothetical protein